MVCVVKEGNSKSVVAAGLRCRGLSPFSFIQSQFTSHFLPTFSLRTSARCTLQLGKLTSWQGNKYCDATLCVCFLSRKKKKRTDENRQKNSKEPDAKCIFISLSARLPSCHSGRSLASSPTLRQGEKQSRGGERTKNKGMGESEGMLATLTYTWQSSFSLTHARTHACMHAHTASTLGSCTHQIMSNEKAELRRMQRGIRGGSPRLSGMTKVKAFKKEELKEELLQISGSLCSPTFLSWQWNGGKN